MSSLDSECVHLRDCEQRKFCEDFKYFKYIDFPQAAHVGQEGPAKWGILTGTVANFFSNIAKLTWFCKIIKFSQITLRITINIMVKTI